MALHEVSLESEAVDVSVSQTGLRVAVLRRNAIDILEWNFEAKPIPPPSQICSVPVTNDGFTHQICFIGELDFFCLSSGLLETRITGYRLDSLNNGCFRRLGQRSDFGIARIFPRYDHEKICIQSYDGTIEQADISGDSLGFGCIARFPFRQPWRYSPLTHVETVHHEDKVREPPRCEPFLDVSHMLIASS
jgi:hypothetical protein